MSALRHALVTTAIRALGWLEGACVALVVRSLTALAGVLGGRTLAALAARRRDVRAALEALSDATARITAGSACNRENPMTNRENPMTNTPGASRPPTPEELEAVKEALAALHAGDLIGATATLQGLLEAAASPESPPPMTEKELRREVAERQPETLS